MTSPKALDPVSDMQRYLRLAQYEADDRTPEGIDADWFRMTPFVAYDPATGEILEWGTMSFAGLAHQAETMGKSFLPQPGARDTHYVDLATMSVREKTACPAVQSGTTLTGLPIPSTLTVRADGLAPQTYTVDDGTAELTFESPAVWTVTVTSVPYLPGTYTMDTTA